MPHVNGLALWPARANRAGGMFDRLNGHRRNAGGGKRRQRNRDGLTAGAPGAEAACRGVQIGRHGHEVFGLDAR